MKHDKFMGLAWLIILMLMGNAFADTKGPADLVGPSDSQCRATYAVDEGTLSVPCIKVLNPVEGSQFYAAELQQIPDTEPLQFSVMPISESNNENHGDSCVATYAVESGEVYLPCVNMMDSSGEVESGDMAFQKIATDSSSFQLVLSTPSPEITNLPKPNSSLRRLRNSANEISSLLSTSHVTSWAYFAVVHNGQTLWYIANSQGYTYLLDAIKNGNVGWGEIAGGQPVATLDFYNNLVFIRNDAASKTSRNAYYIEGIKEWAYNSTAYDYASLINGKTLYIAWYFFLAPNGYWYIVNSQTSQGTEVYRLALNSTGTNYDWQGIDTRNWTTQFFQQNSVWKVKFTNGSGNSNSDTGCQAVLSNSASTLCWLFDKVDKDKWNLSSGYGVGQGDHHGDDYYADDWNLNSGGDTDLGKNLYSATAGKVIFAGVSEGISDTSEYYGKQVIVQSNNDFAIRYTHLNSISVNVGDNVYAGTFIGTIGKTGLPPNQCKAPNYYCAHLHLVVYKNINQISPKKGLGQTGLYWLKKGNILSVVDYTSGPTIFAARFEVAGPQ
jgi:murein DD-endopeptidase MepM/ murein hydrolase activator NlpD